MMHTKIDITAN